MRLQRGYDLLFFLSLLAPSISLPDKNDYGSWSWFPAATDFYL